MERKIKLLLTFLVLSISCAFAQGIKVDGTVLDETGQAVIGATIREKGVSTNGTVTDMDGHFTIKVKDGATLIVSYIGYQTLEVKAAAKMTIRLKTDQELLDEVVVVGYGSARKISSSTASVVKVSSKDLESKPSPNVFDGLQGKVTGLQIYSSSGEPGQLMDIKLHGNGSLGLSSSPLYVLDGVPVSSGTIQGLNPNDLESVQVLKDASATAIYGSRASNGVIFLTTKKGEAGERAQITLTGQYGTSALADRSFYDGFLSSRELMDYLVDIDYYSKEDGEKILAANPHDTKWHDYFYRDDAPIYNTTLSISGGKGRTNYFLSGQHFYQEGLMSQSKYTKSNFRLNLNTEVNKWLTISSNNAIYYDNSLTNHGGVSNYINGGIFYINQPWYTPYKEDGTPYWDERIPGVNFYNPRYVEANNPETSSTFEYVGNLQATIRPVKGLTLVSRVGLDFSNYYDIYKRDPRYKPTLNNGDRYEYYYRGIEWTITNTAEYNFKIADIHDITLLAGHEYNQYDGNGFSAEGWGIKDYRLMHFSSVTDPTKKEISSSLSQYAYLSFFGRLSYGLMDRYYLDLTVRNDASSKFPEAHRNATFWSVGLKWNMADEDWMDGVDWINRFDVKASTGTAGNSSLTNYAYWALAAPSNDFQGEPSMAIATPGNPDLTWETQMKTTVGIDGRFFDNRLGVDLEYYHRLTTDMVMDVPYPLTSGISSNTMNVGTYRNQGIDLHFDVDIWKDRKGNLVNFYSNFNYNADKILKLFQGKETWPMPNVLLMYHVGDPMTYMMPIFKGVNPDNGNPVWYLPGEDTGVTTKDDNNVVEGYYNEDALSQNTGVRRNAPMSGGFGLYATYAGFYMQADFSYYIGKYMINNDAFFYTNSVLMGGGNIRKEALDYWKQPGDQVELPDAKRYDYVMQFDSRLLDDASFLRLKNLTVGYNVPRDFIAKQDFFRSAKISFSGRNLLTFTKFIGPDPEADTNLSYGRNPATRQLIVGLELGF